MTEGRYLLDINVLVALIFQDHVHNASAVAWFDVPGGRRWVMCPLTEMGFLRVAMATWPGVAQMEMVNASLGRALDDPGLEYLPVRNSWRELTRPFARRIHGPKQVADAYLLGLAIRENLVLVTFDKRLMHLAGSEFQSHVLLLGAG